MQWYAAEHKDEWWDEVLAGVDQGRAAGITRNGERCAVIVPIDTWHALLAQVETPGSDKCEWIIHS